MLLLFFLLLTSFLPCNTSHPLDPLTPSEFTTIQHTLKTSHLFSSSPPPSFQYIGLADPDKTDILNSLSDHHNSPPPPRRAFIIARSGHKTHEIILDITTKTIILNTVYTGFGFPMFNFEEQTAASNLPFNYTPFLKSIKKRRIKLSEVVCTTFSVGWFGEVEKTTKRVLKILCFLTGDTVNLYMRPVEGITIVVDLDVMEIVDYKDSWANWKFHLGFDVRASAVISLASVQELEHTMYKQVPYKGFVSELFVPYQDPTEEWYYKTLFDAGELGFGLLTVSLQPLTNYPGNAEFFDGCYASQDGSPMKIKNVFYLFEKYSGDSAWRHTKIGIPG
ncbi:hypothetical protein J5N97_010922 [Dioscorea zingiberensis]|uniref:Amine oxidase n=1 Tax=Dioscorea zingiberensis TaxID=325984 RepID=A0A9D5HP31_9LILI|nr:hypothetical protein J5N97_010922 [Dioscorea zingiberensis]